MDERKAAPEPRLLRLVRGCSGVLAVVVVLLTILTVGAYILAIRESWRGPGIPMLIGHLLAAAVALTLQWLADRKTALLAYLASIGVFTTTVITLALWWY